MRGFRLDRELPQEWTDMLRWNPVILRVILVCFGAAMLSPSQSGAGEAVSERD